MIHLITSNQIPIKDIKQNADNFCFVKTKIMISKVEIYEKTIFDFKIFYHDGMDMTEWENIYQSSPLPTARLMYDFEPSPAIIAALDSIADEILQSYEIFKANDPSDEDFMIGVACYSKWNQQIVSYLDKKFRGTDLSCFNLYRSLHITKTTELANIVKNVLQINYVYSEDPIAFAYAIYKAFFGDRSL